MPQSPPSVITTHVKHGGSWMLREAASDSLLYVLDQYKLTVYSYPQGKLVGKIKNKDLYLATGACVDGKGDVYVANYGSDQLFEYSHGGTKLIRTLKPPVGTTGCTVDLKTGDLAVAGNAGLNVYKNARGTPAIYKNTGFEFYYYCGYDSQGNLFVDGYNQPGSGHTVLGELPHGGSTLEMINLGQVIQWPGQVQWDGAHLAVTDDGGVSGSSGVIYRFSVLGSQATEIGETPLHNSGVIHQTWIQNGVVLVPGLCWPKSCYGSSVSSYRYPKGGNAFKKVTRGVEGPLGLVVSAPDAQ
jgi:hypothetical protein